MSADKFNRNDVCNFFINNYPEYDSNILIGIPEHVPPAQNSLSESKTPDGEMTISNVTSRLKELLGHKEMGQWGHGARIMIWGLSKHDILEAIENRLGVQEHQKCTNRTDFDVVFVSPEYGIVIFNIVINGVGHSRDRHPRLDEEDVTTLLKLGMDKHDKSWVDVNRVTIEINEQAYAEPCISHNILTTRDDWKPLDPDTVSVENCALWVKLRDFLSGVEHKAAERRKRNPFLRKKRKVEMGQLLFFVGKCLMLCNMECAEGLLLGDWDRIKRKEKICKKYKPSWPLFEIPLWKIINFE